VPQFAPVTSMLLNAAGLGEQAANTRKARKAMGARRRNALAGCFERGGSLIRTALV
jgi:hypothetical protein